MEIQIKPCKQNLLIWTCSLQALRSASATLKACRTPWSSDSIWPIMAINMLRAEHQCLIKKFYQEINVYFSLLQLLSDVVNKTSRFPPASTSELPMWHPMFHALSSIISRNKTTNWVKIHSGHYRNYKICHTLKICIIVAIYNDQ